MIILRYHVYTSISDSQILLRR